MNMRKIVVSDYDNTFYRSDDDIYTNKQAVEEFMRKNNIFVLATGRSYLSIMDEIKKYYLEYQYLVFCHGDVILKKSHIIQQFFIPNWIKDEIAKILKLKKNHNYIASSAKQTIDINDSNIVRLHIYFNTLEEAKIKQQFIQKNYQDFVHCYLIESNKAIEIISSKTNKSLAIQYIGRLEHINDIYTIGDSYNDICMIEDYHGCIMKNSIKELKGRNYKEYDRVSDFIKDVLKNEI